MIEIVRRVYVAGPYTGKNRGEVQANISKANTIGQVLARRGFHVYVPHTATAHWDNVQDYKYFADLHMSFLTEWATDLYVLPNSFHSKGTEKEFYTAMKLGRSIYAGEEGLETLLKMPVLVQLPDGYVRPFGKQYEVNINEKTKTNKFC